MNTNNNLNYWRAVLLLFNTSRLFLMAYQQLCTASILTGDANDWIEYDDDYSSFFSGVKI